MIEWFVRNPVAANLLMIAIVITGLFSAKRLIPVEVFPSFEIDSISITTLYRGATPGTIADNVSKRIEESIYNLEGIDDITSRSSEGVSTVIAELNSQYDKRKILNKIKLRVDALSTLPSDAERPIISLIEINPGVIQIAVTGDVDNKTLRTAAEKVRDDLLRFNTISLVRLVDAPKHEISIEITSQTLEKYQLSLSDIAQFIRQGSLDVSAGNIKTLEGNILVRTQGQAYTKQEFERIPIIQPKSGKPVRLGDIAIINDGFEESPLITRFNGSNALLIDIQRTGKQSSLELAHIVKDYVANNTQFSTQGIYLQTWSDSSKILKDRLSTLFWSGIQGGILVFLLLSLFLRPAVAFWVFLGVPISFMGSFILMPFFGGTFNMISLFAFITALGIVVDDAIVTGENIYRKMRQGMNPIESAIVGTKQIALPVTFGILTTIVAFYPMTGLGNNRMGFFAMQIPIVAIPVLLFSLIESKLILPCHLSHIKPRNKKKKSKLTQMQINISRGLEQFASNVYQPFLERCIHNKAITLTALIALTVFIISYVLTGYTRFTFFPRVESDSIEFQLTMPETTSFITTSEKIAHIQHTMEQLKQKYTENNISVIKHIYSNVGSNQAGIQSNVGSVIVELTPRETSPFSIKTSELTREARELIGDIAVAKKFTILAEIGRAGEPIHIEFQGGELEQMTLIANNLKQQLKKYPFVFDIQDNYSSGKTEIQLKLNQKAYQLGLNLANVANQVRSSVFGFEAQRIQRGKNEVRVMVRLHNRQRSSLDDLKKIPIRIPKTRQSIPLSDISELTVSQSAESIYRTNRSTIINVKADLDKSKADTIAILSEIKEYLKQQTQSHPNIRFTFKGESQEQAENIEGFISGLILLLICIYALLAIPFKSYSQPFIVMSIMPFSLIGAILGHIILGYDISILSIVGMMALLGVVINDSLVLVDYINQHRIQGESIYQATIKSGVARLRPVLLTSLTTFAGLLPLLLGKNVQAAFLKPMAISLSFGILFATLITLIIVPLFYLMAHHSKNKIKHFFHSILVSQHRASH